MPSTETVELLRAITYLKRCVGALQTRYGATAAVRRLVNDVERLDIDVEDVVERPTPIVSPRRQGDPPDVVPVPDAPYDPSLWRDADDEGVGGRKHQ